MNHSPFFPCVISGDANMYAGVVNWDPTSSVKPNDHRQIQPYLLQVHWQRTIVTLMAIYKATNCKSWCQPCQHVTGTLNLLTIWNKNQWTSKKWNFIYCARGKRSINKAVHECSCWCMKYHTLWSVEMLIIDQDHNDHFHHNDQRQQRDCGKIKWSSGGPSVRSHPQ